MRDEDKRNSRAGSRKPKKRPRRDRDERRDECQERREQTSLGNSGEEETTQACQTKGKRSSGRPGKSWGSIFQGILLPTGSGHRRAETKLRRQREQVPKLSFFLSPFFRSKIHTNASHTCYFLYILYFSSASHFQINLFTFYGLQRAFLRHCGMKE